MTIGVVLLSFFLPFSLFLTGFPFLLSRGDPLFLSFFPFLVGAEDVGGILLFPLFRSAWIKRTRKGTLLLLPPGKLEQVGAEVNPFFSPQSSVQME